MGKNKKKDPAKKAALQAKKDAKADKARIKRAKKEQAKNNAGEEDDDILLIPHGDNASSLDDLLNAYRHRDLVGSKPIVETLEGFPPPRGNFTMTVVEQDTSTSSKKDQQEVYLFGGEYFDGIETIVVDHLLKWTYNTSSKKSQQHEWKQISMPSTMPSPSARCAHSTVYYNGGLWIFGGEFFVGDSYHHYKDLWRYDISTQTWREIKSSGGGSVSLPTPRSGHSAVVWKHFMILFGGFFEATSKDQSQPKWFNDVYVFNLKTEQWLNIPSYSKLGQKPEPRSACNIGLLGDDDKAVIHGGFSKLSSTSTQSQTNGGRETKVHTDAWILHLKPILQDKPPTWERLLSSTNTTSQPHNPRNPNGRCACASVTYKKCNKLLVFGGVVDSELMHHKVDSIFFMDLFCLDYSAGTGANKAKWYPLKVKKKQQQQQQVAAAEPSSQETEAKEEEDNDEEDDGDMNLDQEEEEAEGEGDDGNSLPQQQGWDINQLRENMFAFTDGSGNLVYEKFDNNNTTAAGGGKDEESSDDEEEETKEEETKEEDDDIEDEVEETKQSEKEEKQRTSKKKGKNKKVQVHDSATTTTPNAAANNSKIITSSSVMTLNTNTNTPQPVTRQEPLPRIKCGAIVNKDTLFIYGGLVEIGDREVTLDDMWCLDLKKRTEWKCLYEGTMHKQVWRGAIHDDDDSYISNNDSTTGGGGGGDDDSDDDDEEEKEETKAEAESSTLSLDPQVLELTEQYDLNNPLRTPQRGEALADFYSRTKTYWNEHASEVLSAATAAAGSPDPPTNKELKREGFQLAKKRFDELEPIMDRLKELTLTSGGGGDHDGNQGDDDNDDQDNKKGKKKSKKKKK